MTGSLEKGLMAGLGAYGGANLGAGLAETATAIDPSVVQAQNAVVENAVANQTYNPSNTSLTPEAWLSGQEATKKTLATNLLDARAAAKPVGIMDTITKGFGALGKDGGFSSLYQNLGGSPMSLISKLGPAAAPAIGEAMKPKEQEEGKADADMGQRYGFSMNPTGGQPQQAQPQQAQPQQAQPGQNPLGNTPTPTTTPFPTPDIYGREQRYFSPSYTKFTPEQAKSTYGYADGGVATDPDRPTETPALLAFRQMQAQRAAQPQAPQVDANAQYAEYLKQTMGTPNQMQAPTSPPPTATNLASSGYSYNPMNQQYGQIQGTAPDDSDSDSDSDSNSPFKIGNRRVIGYTSTGEKIYGEDSPSNIFGRAAGGSISHLGDYSDGGRLLRGPGDGVSDSIPAMIGKRQPARLADGEFVVPARIVSELGNGSTEAGARKLYAMMDRIQKARGKTVGKGKVAKNSRSEKYLPA